MSQMKVVRWSRLRTGDDERAVDDDGREVAALPRSDERDADRVEHGGGRKSPKLSGGASSNVEGLGVLTRLESGPALYVLERDATDDADTGERGAGERPRICSTVTRPRGADLDDRALGGME